MNRKTINLTFLVSLHFKKKLIKVNGLHNAVLTLMVLKK